jgi:hypothetical protein
MKTVKTMNRESVINELVDNEMDTLLSKDGRACLESTVRDGVIGFNNLSNDDLIQEYEYLFDEQIKIED